MSLVIIDTKCANLTSVFNAFKRLGHLPTVTADPRVIKHSRRIVLPGVGTAGTAMRELERLALTDTLRRAEQPVLGICLGMQLLSESSTEQSCQKPLPCLNVISGQTLRLASDLNLPLPHMGWNQTTIGSHPLFKGFEEPPWFYFVHSFALGLSPHTISRCEYTQPFSAAVARDNFMGVQFHPERSGTAGARILQNFMEISC